MTEKGGAAVTYEERIAQKPRWQADNAFIGGILFRGYLPGQPPCLREDLLRIRRIIEAYPGKLQENRELRSTAYLALARHLSQIPDPVCMRWHLSRIPLENDKYVLGNMLDWIRYWPCIPPDADITPLLECTRDSRWLVYEGAIEALSLCDTEEAREAVRPFLKREPIRKNEPVYGSVGMTLAKIGTPEDIPVLEELLARANRNIKYNLNWAISGIRMRYPTLQKRTT